MYMYQYHDNHWKEQPIFLVTVKWVTNKKSQNQAHTIKLLKPHSKQGNCISIRQFKLLYTEYKKASRQDINCKTQKTLKISAI